MKKICFLFVCFLFAKMSEAQYSLAFCESVSADGKPQNISNSFQVDSKGSLLKVFVRSDESFNADSVVIKFYFINSKGEEERLEKYSQKTERDWNYVWKELAFFTPGTYRVKVYDDKGNYLTSANLNVKAEQ